MVEIIPMATRMVITKSYSYQPDKQITVESHYPLSILLILLMGENFKHK